MASISCHELATVNLTQSPCHTQHHQDGKNENILGGQYYRYNLLAPPFSLRPDPLDMITESHGKKFMLLYDLSTLEWDDTLSDL